MAQIQDISNENLQVYLQQSKIPNYYLTFLSIPQLSLVLFNKCRNRLLVLLKKQLEVLSTMSNAILFINNVESPISASMTELKIPLLQFDTSGNLNNLNDYKKKVAAFLSTLPLKSGSSNTFAQTSIDSQEDIYASLLTFFALQKDIDVLLANLKSFEGQLSKVDLYKTVVRNLSNYSRNQIDNIDNQKDDISKISIATDLLASTSVMEYFKNLGSLIDGVYLPIVSNKIPASEEIYGYPEQVAAIAISNEYPQTITHQDFKVTIDGTLHSIDFPSTAAKGRSYLLATQSAASYTIPVNTRLYIKITCPTLPMSRLLPEGPLCPIGTIAIDLPSGVQTFSAIAAAITTGLYALDTGAAMVQFGYCDAFSIAGSNRLLIYGKSDVTQLEIVDGPGKWVGATGIYTPSYLSCHSALFFNYSKSDPTNTPSYQDLKDCLAYYIPVTFSLNKLQIQSPTTGPSSSIIFTTSIATDIGFTNSSPQPSYLILKSKGAALTLAKLNVYTGCYYQDVYGNFCQLTINGEQIELPITIPNVEKIELQIFPDLTFLVKAALPLIKSIIPYAEKLEQTWLPILNSPTVTQIAVAKKYLEQVRGSINNIVAMLTKDVKDSVFVQLANSLFSQLESKGLTKLVNDLNNLDLTSFFAAQMDDSSFGLKTMSKIEALNG